VKDDSLIKINAYLLLLVIPLSAAGYYFAVNKESLFFIYEWLLIVLVGGSIILAVFNIIKIKSKLKWIPASILSFLIQFTVFGLFMGPLTYSFLFYVYYLVALAAFVVFITTLKKNGTFKTIPIIFSILTVILTLYMAFLNALWGNRLS
jgi:hypothetical protein